MSVFSDLRTRLAPRATLLAGLVFGRLDDADAEMAQELAAASGKGPAGAWALEPVQPGGDNFHECWPASHYDYAPR